MSKEKQSGSYAAQCADGHNTPIAMAVDGSTPRLHKAAKVNGLQSGNSSKPTSNHGK